MKLCLKLCPKNLFSDTRSIYKWKTTGELWRALSLLHLCSYSWFGRNAFKIFTGLNKCLGRNLFSALFKPAVYNLYVAGDGEKDILSAMQKLEGQNLKPLLSPMLEEDLGTKSCEEVHVTNFKTILNCVDLAARGCSKQPKTLAIKLTGFMSPVILQKMTQHMDMTHGNVITVSQMLTGLTDESISTDQKSVAPAGLSKLKIICDTCRSQDVKLFIDAEMADLQPAVRLMTVGLMAAYNKNQPVIYNTYQCYLTCSMEQVKQDLEIAKSLNFTLGCKVVRGAYLEAEAALCQRDPDRTYPIYPSYEETNLNYDRVVAMLIRETEDSRAGLVVATHNKSSILQALQIMDQSNMSIHFAQLNGMADQISLGLALQGHSVLKLIPCGSISDVLPWLARRMQENASAMERTQWDRSLLKQEIARRLKLKLGLT